MKRIHSAAALFLLFTFCAVLFSGCKKDEDEKVKETKEEPDLIAQNQQILTSQSWKITNLVTGGFSIWNTPLIEPCFKDNLYTFNEDHTLEVDEGELKCNETDPQTFMGEWKLIDEQNIYVNALIFSDTSKIIEISSSQIIIDGTFMEQNAVVTFKPN